MPCKLRIWYCFVCETIFSVHLWIYSVPNGTLASKLKILYFLPPFCPKFCPFCTFLSFHILFMAYTVQFWYCFICTTILSVHLWIYSVSIGKLALKLTILYFYLHFAQNLALFATSRACTTYLCLEKYIFGIVLFV